MSCTFFCIPQIDCEPCANMRLIMFPVNHIGHLSSHRRAPLQHTSVRIIFVKNRGVLLGLLKCSSEGCEGASHLASRRSHGPCRQIRDPALVLPSSSREHPPPGRDLLHDPHV